MFGTLALQRGHSAHKMPSLATGIESSSLGMPFFQVFQVKPPWSLVLCLLFLCAQLSSVILKPDTLLASPVSFLSKTLR